MKLFPFILLIWLVSCEQIKESESINVNYNRIVENEYATTFQIIEHDDYAELIVLDPISGKVDYAYVIGDTGFQSKKLEDSIVCTNPMRIITLSSTHIGMLNKLNLSNRIVGASNSNFFCNPLLMNKEIISTGDYLTENLEKIIEIKPDLIITSGFENPDQVSEKLKSFGIKVIVNYDWKETHPLGRAEWIKVFGLLFNKQEQANELFNEIKKSYLTVKDQISTLDCQKTVMVGTFYNDIFNSPAGESYMAHLLKDLNANYCYANSKGVGSLNINLEEFLINNIETDIWINVAASNKNEIFKMNARFALLKAFQTSELYSYSWNLNCYWENSALEPHVLLLDLAKIIYPEEFDSNDLVYYQKLND